MGVAGLKAFLARFVFVFAEMMSDDADPPQMVVFESKVVSVVDRGAASSGKED